MKINKFSEILKQKVKISQGFNVKQENLSH